jgi:prophage antirepressor-like protein
MHLEFNGQALSVTPTEDHRQWYMTVDEVAQGYGVGRNTIMMHLKNHADELRDGIEKGVNIVDTPGGPQEKTVLFRDGVIKLGFFIRSDNAAAFRQWATDVITGHLDDRGIGLGRFAQMIESRFEAIDGRIADHERRIKSYEKALDIDGSNAARKLRSMRDN